mgnify:CR=1 FL=1
MGVRGTDRGGPPKLKSVEISSVPGREGLHLLGQSLRSANPLFAALFGSGPHRVQNTDLGYVFFPTVKLAEPGLSTQVKSKTSGDAVLK